jgi:hypothetical protein
VGIPKLHRVHGRLTFHPHEQPRSERAQAFTSTVDDELDMAALYLMIGRRMAKSEMNTSFPFRAVGRWHGSARRYQPIPSRTPVITNCTAMAARSSPMIRVITRIPVCPIFTTSPSPTRNVSHAIRMVSRIEP